MALEGISQIAGLSGLSQINGSPPATGAGTGTGAPGAESPGMKMIMDAEKNGQIKIEGAPEDKQKVLETMAKNIDAGSTVGQGIVEKLKNGERFEGDASINERSHASVGSFTGPDGVKTNLININPNDGENLIGGERGDETVIAHELLHNMGLNHGQEQERLIAESLDKTANMEARA
jgi:hypothetical protein